MSVYVIPFRNFSGCRWLTKAVNLWWLMGKCFLQAYVLAHGVLSWWCCLWSYRNFRQWSCWKKYFTGVRVWEFSILPYVLFALFFLSAVEDVSSLFLLQASAPRQCLLCCYRLLGTKAQISFFFFFYKLCLVLAFLSQEQNLTKIDPNTSHLGVSQLYQNLKCVVSASVEIQGKIRTWRQSWWLKPTNWYVLDMRNKGRHSTVRALKTQNRKWEAVCLMTLQSQAPAQKGKLTDGGRQY